MSDFFHYSHIHQNHFAKLSEVVEYKKNQYLVWRKDESPWVFFLLEGIVKVTFSFKDGSTRFIGYFTPGMTFAQSGSFLADPDGKIEYVATENIKVYRIKKELFLEALDSNLEFCREYLNITLKNQIFLIERIIYQGEKNIDTKFAHWLLFMNKYYGETQKTHRHIYIPITQEIIANFLHITRESINATIQKFVKAKYINIVNKRIIINDKKALQEIIQNSH